MIVLALVGLSVGGCYRTGPRPEFQSADRARRLMAMAGEEAAQIPSPEQRLERLMKIADMQIRNGENADARRTLAQAWRALEDAAAGELDEHTRLAGWVSISELSRRAGDRTTAWGACDEATRMLRALEPATRRCEYVRGVAAELRELRGKAAAAELLRQAGEWAVGIKDHGYRRKALAAMASDLFFCDDYAGGRAMLHVDDEAAWRSQTLASLARDAVPQTSFGLPLGYSLFFAAGKSK